MAQQTRLETMLPYYKRWMKRFPSIEALATSSEQDVLSLWEGLGYYSRARNFWRAAQLVVTQYRGKLPDDVAVLSSLPGIGAYTAGAIASMAFGKDEPAVDGNAIRVLARVFNVRQPVDSAQAAKRFRALAVENLPRGKAAEYNQALMDLGATLCKPRQPQCPKCPLRSDCISFALGIQEKRPVRKPTRQIPLRYFAAAVIEKSGKVLVFQRPARDLLGGLWGFPNEMGVSPRQARSKLNRGLRKNMVSNLRVAQKLGQYEHTYSHFKVNLQVYAVRLNGSSSLHLRKEHVWVPITSLGELPMGKLDRQIALALRDNTDKGDE